METGKYLLNGGSVVTPFPKLVAFGGTLLEYSGSSSVTERINSTKPLQKKLLVQVCKSCTDVQQCAKIIDYFSDL